MAIRPSGYSRTLATGEADLGKVLWLGRPGAVARGPGPGAVAMYL